jgi:hypothetical protein
VISDKLKTAIENSTKVRLEDLFEDKTITVGNEWVEDSMRIICNNTGKGNFKVKIEDLKKFVIKKAPEVGEDGVAKVDEKSENAEENLRWFIHYVLTKRLGTQSQALQGIYIDMIRELHFSIQANDRTRSVIR